MMSLLEWLQNYYANKIINESHQLINIYTMDNPGWHVEIDLRNTKYKKMSLELLKIDNGDNDWAFININDGVFDGASDKFKLCFMVGFFRDLCQNNIYTDSNYDIGFDKNDLLYWLQNSWFCSLDFGWDGMQYHGIKIIMESNRSWHVEIELLDTCLENIKFDNIRIYKTNNDWVNITVLNNIFKGYGDRNKLVFIMTEFKKWVERYK